MPPALQPPNNYKREDTMYSANLSIELKEYSERLTTEEAAQALCLSKAALDQQLSRGTLILPFIKVGRSRMFLKEDIETFLRDRFREARSEANAQLKQAS